MPAPEQILADLAAHPPSAPTPVEQIRTRARGRVRRRRALVAAAAVLVVVAVGAGVGAVTGDDPADEITAGPGPTTAPPSSTSEPSITTAEPPEETLTLDPADGLVDGAVVTITLDEQARGEVVVAQCTSEVRDLPLSESSAVLDHCSGITYGRAEDPLSLTVRRVLHTAAGPVDCAQPERCLVAVRVGGANGTDDRHAVLRFRDDLPPIADAEVVVEGAAGPVRDGDRLRLRFTGVETGESIAVAQCVRTDSEDGLSCSSARSLYVPVQDGPDTELPFTVFHDVLVDTVADEALAPVWVPCAPCTLLVQVGDRRLPVAEVPLDIVPTDAPVRPVVFLDRIGPVPVGSTVDVSASGLQPGSDVSIGWCPTERAAGGGDPACRGSDGVDGDVVRVAADGRASLRGLPVPEPTRLFPGVDCSQPGLCGIGLDADDMWSALGVVPMTITP